MFKKFNEREWILFDDFKSLAKSSNEESEAVSSEPLINLKHKHLEEIYEKLLKAQNQDEDENTNIFLSLTSEEKEILKNLLDSKIKLITDDSKPNKPRGFGKKS